MAIRKVHLALAVSLTALDGFVLTYFGVPVWTAWSGCILEPRPSVDACGAGSHLVGQCVGYGDLQSQRNRPIKV